jgi:putative endonuclease
VYYVYVLKSSKDKKIYTGYSSDLKRRILEHKSGLVKSTRNRRPIKLIYYEAFLSEKDAKNREKYLKSGGKAKISLKLQIKNSLLENN